MAIKTYSYFRVMRQEIELTLMVPRVLEVAQAAGRAITSIYQQHCAAAPDAACVVLPNKTDESPLTLADLAAHRVICEGLRRIAPALPIVSEEDELSHAHGAAQGRFWLVDPLDGTREFLARNGEFTVNIALVQDGAPLWGVVLAPIVDQMYWGGAGLGAWRRCAGGEVPIRVAPRAAGACYRVVASRRHMNDRTREFVARLGESQIVHCGSSLKFCRVAEGAADVYPRLGPTSEWDTAAAQAVVEGGGGMVVDLAGRRLRYGKARIANPDFVVTSAPLDCLG